MTDRITTEYPEGFDPLELDVTVEAPPDSDAPTLRRPPAGVELEGAGEWIEAEPDDEGEAALWR